MIDPDVLLHEHGIAVVVHPDGTFDALAFAGARIVAVDLDVLDVIERRERETFNRLNVVGPCAD